MATFTGFGKSHNGGKSCENFIKFHFILPIPPCKRTSMYPNTIVLKTTLHSFASQKQKTEYPNLIYFNSYGKSKKLFENIKKSS